MNILNIAAYKFVSLQASCLPELKDNLKTKVDELQLKGTILLSVEGINLFIAGLAESVKAFQIYLQELPYFAHLEYKESWSAAQPFEHMFVKIKTEIIPFGIPEIAPEQFTAPRISPATLKQWYDENKEMVVLDTRNDYEIQFGKFAKAVDLDLKHFRDFPKAIEEKFSAFKDKPIVTYCTGGIRCEKAATWLLQAGFKEVYQLDGGILNYFEQHAGAHYEGDCFVFDARVAVDPNLEEVQK